MPVLRMIWTILSELATAMSGKEIQIRDNDPAEALHDYRIAVRKTRSLLAELEGIIPEPELTRFKEGFSAITERTGTLRDLEVCLAALADYRTGARQKDIAALVEYIESQQRIQRQRMARYFQSRKYRDFLHAWSKCLHDGLNGVNAMNRAGFPVLVVVRGAIQQAYLKVLEQGARTVRRGSTRSFHKTRKSCKRLRYLLDIFRDLLPGDFRKKLAKDLKELQGKLGRIQDIEVIVDMADQFVEHSGDRLRRVDKKAMKHLVKKMKREKREVKAEAAALLEKFPVKSAEEIYLLLRTTDS
jgi:CHAD domain-containing protein